MRLINSIYFYAITGFQNLEILKIDRFFYFRIFIMIIFRGYLLIVLSLIPLIQHDNHGLVDCELEACVGLFNQCIFQIPLVETLKNLRFRELACS